MRYFGIKEDGFARMFGWAITWWGFCMCRREATGLPTTITIRFKERVFHLHKVCIQAIPTSQAFGYLSQRFSCSEVVLFFVFN